DLNTGGDPNILSRFRVRPVTSHTTDWYIQSIQLWWDQNGEDGLQTQGDSLINTQLSSNFGFIQSEPTTQVAFTNLPAADLSPTSTFYVALKVDDWNTSDPEDEEIIDQDDVWFGVTISETAPDLAVSPILENPNVNWGGDHEIHFTIQAENLPVVVRNLDPSVEEGPAYYANENMFFPNFYEMDGSADSKLQRIHDLTFTADVYLPTDFIEDSLQQASFWVSWDNSILELDTMIHGDVWDDASPGSVWDDPNFGTVFTDTTNPNYSRVYFGSMIIGSPVGINNNSLPTLDFNVIKPGISPISLSYINIWDQWGIQYHEYQILQNNLQGAETEYDAWAKFTLGDYAGANSGGVLNGIGDSKIDNNDISLYSDNIFIGSSSDDWYNRFDIGAPGFRDPEGIVQYDDTTNFYDLLIIGTNYYRSQKGQFNQKPVSYNKPLEVLLSTDNSEEKSDIYELKLSVNNAADLLSAQAKIKYDPNYLEFLNLKSGDWVDVVSPEHLILQPPENKGMVDINFLSLSEPLNGNGDLAIITFKAIGGNKPEAVLEYFDPRDINGDKIQYKIQTELSNTIPEYYTVLTNYPNPFNPSTDIVYIIPENLSGNYTLEVYDILGNRVRTLINEYHSTGKYKTSWDGKNSDDIAVVSGVYLIKLSGPGINEISRITLLR
ncbi:MAG: T9SS type A sorting domain-containing protein, partial [Candidatus Marinimicrobia bacterium]|nr:T9SS type A sorting domain-containing protein [Candidatus Neomarinimicrobiota bacterium]